MKPFLKANEKEMWSLLETLVNIDSGSGHKKGVDLVGEVLQEKYLELGFTIETMKEDVQGNHLVMRHVSANNPKIMAVAHMDTVFPVGTAKARPFNIQGECAYGPGVSDMKASHVVLFFALKALHETKCVGLENIVVLLTSDEEIGSLTSRKLIEKHAEAKDYALIMEAARPNGALVTARRGAGEYTIHVTGKAAHSGLMPRVGSSAIEELAHKIIRLHKLNEETNGVSINVGLIDGGSTVNTVAPTAVAHVDVRISKPEQAALIDQKIKEICAVPDVAGTTIVVLGGIERPPMVKNEQTVELYKIIQDVGKTLGIAIHDVAAGGGSDASFTSAKGIATIDGLGPIGGGAHTEEEYLETTSLLERTELLANVIQRLTVGEK